MFTAVPEPEEDEETGETLNTEAIEAAKAANRANAQKWLDTVADCEEKAGGDFEGVHFHWLMEEVNQEEIESVAECRGRGGNRRRTEGPRRNRTQTRHTRNPAVIRICWTPMRNLFP